MPIYPWQRRPTESFGEVWVSIAELQVQGRAGRWHTLAVQIDSGAVISLLRRSYADLFGVRLESGTRVALHSVAGGQATAFVHEFPVRFGNELTMTVPVAIADRETVPTLLGRLGVFEHLHIAFDGAKRHTSIEPVSGGDHAV